MGTMASQITSLTIVYSIVYSGAGQRKHQSSASQAFVRRFHRGPVNFPHKWPVTRKCFHLMTSSWPTTWMTSTESKIYTKHKSYLTWLMIEWTNVSKRLLCVGFLYLYHLSKLLSGLELRWQLEMRCHHLILMQTLLPNESTVSIGKNWDIIKSSFEEGILCSETNVWHCFKNNVCLMIKSLKK